MAPHKFCELVGQEHVVSAFSNALDNESAVTMLTCLREPRGVGKNPIARIFSKSLIVSWV